MSERASGLSEKTKIAHSVNGIEFTCPTCPFTPHSNPILKYKFIFHLHTLTITCSSWFVCRDKKWRKLTIDGVHARLLCDRLTHMLEDVLVWHGRREAKRGTSEACICSRRSKVKAAFRLAFHRQTCRMRKRRNGCCESRANIHARTNMKQGR